MWQKLAKRKHSLSRGQSVMNVPNWVPMWGTRMDLMKKTRNQQPNIAQENYDKWHYKIATCNPLINASMKCLNKNLFSVHQLTPCSLNSLSNSLAPWKTMPFIPTARAASTFVDLCKTCSSLGNISCVQFQYFRPVAIHKFHAKHI